MASAAQPFMGTWHVAYSTLGMWKGGARSNPRLVYTELSDSDGVVTWTDTVLFDQPRLFSSHPSQTSIVGTDTATVQSPLNFRWTGRGLLRFLHSECKVLAHDPDCTEFAVVHFGATLFSEEGLDVLTRSEGGLPQQRLEGILAGLDPAVQRFVQSKGLDRTKSTAHSTA